MTDRFNALTVILDRDIREDDAEHLINAIKMMRGVADVRGEMPQGVTAMVERTRLVNDLSDKIFGLLRDVRDGK